MLKVPLRGVLISLIGLVAVGGLIAGGGEKEKVVAPESTEAVTGEINFTIGACKTSGTTLVVDFGTGSGAEPIIRCVNGFTGTGWQLFKSAGLRVEGTSEYPEAFVCRINDFPSATEEDCLGTPNPIQGSWRYFFAEHESSKGPGAKTTWMTSPVGAASHLPKCGSVEGWLFVKQPLTLEKSQTINIPAVSPSPISCQ